MSVMAIFRQLTIDALCCEVGTRQGEGTRLLHNRHDRGYGSPFAVGIQNEASTQITHSFTHPSQSNSDFAAAVAKCFQAIAGNAAAVVFHPERYILVIEINRDFYSRTSRVPVNVRQAFLHYTKQCKLRILLQAWKTVRDIALDFATAAPRERVYIPTRRGPKPNFVQQRWVQQVRDRARFLEALFHCLQAMRQTFGPIGVWLRLPFQIRQ